jgi:hypothetical protein
MLRTLDRLTDTILQAQMSAGLEDLTADSKRHIMRRYRCPFTGAIMTDPVTDKEGIDYERANIELWIAENEASPISGKTMLKSELLPNRSLRNMIEDTIAALNPTTETKKYQLSELLTLRYLLSLTNHCNIGESIDPKIIPEIEAHAQKFTISDWRPDQSDVAQFSHFTWRSFRDLRVNVYGEFARVQNLSHLNNFTKSKAEEYFIFAMTKHHTKSRLEQLEIAIRLFGRAYTIVDYAELKHERKLRWLTLFRIPPPPEPQPPPPQPQYYGDNQNFTSMPQTSRHYHDWSTPQGEYR